MKIGIEVEGRLKGLLSLFINTDELSYTNLYNTFNQHKDNIVAIYISDNSCAIDLRQRGVILKYLNLGFIITIEAPSFNHIIHDKEIYERCHLVLNIDKANDFFTLKDTDSIKFSNSDKSVFMYTKELAYKTKASDFNNDKEI
jgi:hypothetical protein